MRMAADRAVYVVLSLAVLVGCGAGAAGPGASPAQNGPAAGPGSTVRQAAAVVSIADGDTVRLKGIGAGPLPRDRTVRVRLLEVDAPETTDCGYREATARLAGLMPRGTTVRVERDRDLRDRFDRYLLYLWTEDGRFVNETVVAQGFARAVLFRPNDAYIDRIRDAETAARRDRRGLWAACGAAG